MVSMVLMVSMVYIYIERERDGGVFNDAYKDIYTPELQLKVEHSGTHATFLNLDITVKDGVFV